MVAPPHLWLLQLCHATSADLAPGWHKCGDGCAQRDSVSPLRSRAQAQAPSQRERRTVQAVRTRTNAHTHTYVWSDCHCTHTPGRNRGREILLSRATHPPGTHTRTCRSTEAPCRPTAQPLSGLNTVASGLPQLTGTSMQEPALMGVGWEEQRGRAPNGKK